MKTIEEASIEYAVKESNIDNSKPVEIEQQLYAHELMYAFQAGAEFERKNNEEKLQKQNETLLKITGWDQPYNLTEILSRLVFATDYLLHVKDYDGQNYEELNQSIDRAKEIMQFLETREAHFL